MAFFKFRKNSNAPAGAPAPTETVDRMRERARHRLIGSSLLVLIGVIGFPLLFDKQPRPIALDTPIDIPDKTKLVPLVIPAMAASEAIAGGPALATSSAPLPAATASLAPATELITESAEVPKPLNKIDQKVALVPVNQASLATKNVAVSKSVKAPSTAASSASAKLTEAAKAQALLDGQPPESQPIGAVPRYVVQVGAFADPARARDVRLKVEHAGLKTYTHVADTKDGKRIRVRVGPFAVKSEAEQVAKKIKKLNLPAALLTL
jgi:DedD protein